MNRKALPALLCAALAHAAFAHAESFAVKTGGWEMTMNTTMRNLSLPPEAAKLPPEKRAAIEKSMQGRSGRTDSRTYKTCVTKEDLESGQGLTPDDDDDDAKCVFKVITNTRTKLEQERTCASPPSTTKARFEAKDAEHFIGVIERTGTGSGGPGNVRVELAGRWASASCKGFDD